jgi:hypothetical protein
MGAAALLWDLRRRWRKVPGRTAALAGKIFANSREIEALARRLYDLPA